MSAPNGHAQEDHAPVSGPLPAMRAPGVFQIPAQRVKELVAALEVPFDSAQIEWRVMNTTKGQQPARGQVVPYPGPAGLYRPIKRATYPSWVDAEIHHSYKRKL
jgi:hypothetical protein